MNLKSKLIQLQNERTAIVAANYYNFETCKGILLAAQELKQPVILQLTKSSLDYMGIKTAVSIGRTLSEELDSESWIHLDHCGEIEFIKRCLDAGFDSVMIDASDKPMDENIKITKEVVEFSSRYNVVVEAELGSIPQLGMELEDDKFTKPKEAKQFADLTGIDALAVAIGSKHGFYREEPRLDQKRLKGIKNSTDVCLVLHGGSGISDMALKEAVRNGIVKVNIATETKDTFTRTLKEVLNKSEEIDLRKTFPEAINSVKELIVSKMKTISFNNL